MYRYAGMYLRNVRYSALKYPRGLIINYKKNPPTPTYKLPMSAQSKRFAFPTVEMSYNKLLAGPERMNIGFVRLLRVRGNGTA